MKATGIVWLLDDLGRIVLPKELRRTMDMSEKTPIEIFVEGDKIVLRKYQPETWTVDELKDALIAASKDAGRDAVDYLAMVRKEKA